MVKEEPVSVRRQTIYCLIPVLDMYAAYRVKRLRWYLLIMLLGVGVPLSIMEGLLFPIDSDLVVWSDYDSLFMENPLSPLDADPSLGGFFAFYYSDPSYLAFSIFSWTMAIPIAILLIRRWSFKWNERFPRP